MSANSLITVNGIALPQPYQYQWTIQDVSAPSAGRTEDALMHKEQVAQKRKIQIAWRIKNPEETSMILSAFNSEYFMVTYFDMLDNQYETREFYAGDRQANVKLWWVGRKYIDTISLDIIER